MTFRTPIGQILLGAGLIDSWQLQSALADQKRWGGRLGESLVRLGFISEHALLEQVARQHGVPYVEIADRPVPPQVVRLVPEKLIRSRKLFPIAHAGAARRGMLVVATSEPQNLEALDEVAFATGQTVKAALASDRDIARAIERHLGEPPPPPRPEPWRAPSANGAHRHAA
ncbi:MAG TPA: hypothetical protein VLV17_02920 [Anaeromyxobacteraceae bacterium]|nr:hypothetical protein [Anaeromyxobacteraceae bacterium]